jgi:hypothetical protein
MSDIELVDESELTTDESTNNQTTVSPYQLNDVFSSDEQRQKFVGWVSSEIIDVRDGGERKDRELKWESGRRMRRAKKSSDKRNTPWINSAAIESTLAAQKCNAIYAKEVAAFAIKKPPIQVTPGKPEDIDQAASLQKFFEHVGSNTYGMNMPVNQNRLFYDQVSLGMGIAKVPFLIDQWSFKRTSADTGTEQVNYVRHKGPAVVPIRAEDFFTRPYWKDIQRAPWVAVRYRLFQHELDQKVALMFFDQKAVEIVAPATKLDDAAESSLRDASISSQSYGSGQQENKVYEIYEVNAFYDVDGDGYAEDVIAWIDPDTQTLLRSEFNPLSIRDLEFIPYIDDPESLYPIGVMDLVADLQDEATSLKRMRLDGTRLSMLKMFFSRTGSGIDPDQTFSPFMHLQVDNPLDDIRVIDFPDISQSCLAGEELCKQEADRVTGANDYMTGFNDSTVGSGASVGGTMFLAQQGNSILNSILTRAEQSIGNIYMMALYQCMANRDNVDLSFLTPDDQANMQLILSLNVEDIPTKFRFKVETTDISKTDESQRQNVLGATQLYSMYGQSILQLAAQSPQLQPMIPEITLKLAVGATALLETALDKMGIANPQSMLPYLDHIAAQLNAVDFQRAAQTRQMKGMLNEQLNSGSAGQLAGQTGPSSGQVGPATDGLGGSAPPMAQGSSGVAPGA